MRSDLVEDGDARRTSLAIGALGTVAAVALLLASTGSNDIRVWESFARQIDAIGISELYKTDSAFNHPPLMGYLAWLCLRASEWLGIRFSTVFKLWPVLANLGAGLLLLKLGAARGEERAGRRAFALYGWSICALLIGAYHGNTDCIAVFGCIGCLYLLDGAKRPGLAGLALAAAVNVKIIPALLFLPLLATQRSRRAAIRFTAGAATAVVPFALAWIGARGALVSNVFAYQSRREPWGFRGLSTALGALPGVGHALGENLMRAFYFLGGSGELVLLSVVALAAYGYLRRMPPARMMAATFCLFLVFAPGFGVQYVVYPVAPMLAVSAVWGVTYDVLAGVFILLVYVHFRGEGFPLWSDHNADIPTSLSPVGLAAWAVAVGFLVDCFRRGGAGARGSATEPRTSGAPTS